MNRSAWHSPRAAVTVLLGATLSVVGPVAAEPAPPTVLNARLVDEFGAPIANALVRVEVVPTAATVAASEYPMVVLPDSLGAVRTNASGEFTVAAALPDQSPYLHPDGSVSLQISSFGPEHELVYEVLAFPPSPAQPGWTWQADDTEILGAGGVLRPTEAVGVSGAVTRQALTGLEFRAATGYVWQEPSLGTTRDTLVGSVPLQFGGGRLPSGATEATSAADETCEGTQGTALVATDTYRRSYVPIQRIKTLRRSQIRYEWSTTEKTKLEIAVTGSEGKYAGGFTYSQQHDTETGLGKTFPNKTSKVMKIQWRYRKYKVYCMHTANIWSDSGVREWKPIKWTGGSANKNNDNVWTCDKKWTVKMANETWVVRTSSVTWLKWFSIAGVGLSDKQMNTEVHKMTIYPDKGVSAARICGDNDFPIYADRVKEIRF